VYLLFTRFLAYDLAMFSDSMRVLALVPHVTSIVVAWISSLISPQGLAITLIGALPATSIGFGSLTFIAPWAHRLRGGRIPIGNIPANKAVIVLGVLFALFFCCVGLGISWTIK
jgi:hypothetical protein